MNAIKPPDDSVEQLRSLEQTQRATLNILEDFHAERQQLEQVQRATLNVLDDFDDEKERVHDVQRATLNILEDFHGEKAFLESTQRAVLNILEDIAVEKNKVASVNQQLEASNKELEAFTYSVSHDLRAPLRHIDGFSRLLMGRHNAELSEGAREYLTLICDSTREMSQLVDDLLSLSRIGRRELSVQVAGLKTLAEEVLNGLRRDHANRTIEWRVGELPFAECDPGLMKQVLTNLLSNAVKFTRQRERAVIEVGTQEQEGQTAIYVRDNGVGFDNKHADKLFRVFQRLHRQEDFEGTGVGLAIVHRIIQKHGGRVWAKGELNKGATFYFTTGAPPEAETYHDTEEGRDVR